MANSEDFAKDAAELRWQWINAEDSAERQRLIAMVADLVERQKDIRGHLST